MPQQIIPNNWEPREYQEPLWQYFDSKGIGFPGARAAAVCHRRWGKDDVALHLTAASAMEKPATYWHMLPLYSQARKAIWDAVNPHTGKKRIDEAFPHSIRKRTDNQSMFIEFITGSTWQVVGSDNYNSLVGSPPYGLVFSEWSIANPAAWSYLSPILMENGGWAFFIYTSRGKNHGYSLYQHALSDPRWFGLLQTAEDTGVFTPDQLDEARRDLLSIYVDEDEADAVFQQEYFCSFDAALPGSYYGKLIVELEKANRVTSVPYNPEFPVYTSWDLGLDDSTAIWFAQIIGAEVRIIDYYEINNRALIDVARDILKKPYVYAEHYLPHDVETRELSTAKTRKEQLESIGLKPIRPGSKLPVVDGINAARTLLRKCTFDGQKTAKGLSGLRSYRREFDEEKKVYKDKPLHDWSSHGADAFRELAVNLFDVKQRSRRQKIAEIEYDPYNYSPDPYNGNVRRDETVIDYDPYNY